MRAQWPRQGQEKLAGEIFAKGKQTRAGKLPPKKKAQKIPAKKAPAKEFRRAGRAEDIIGGMTHQ